MKSSNILLVLSLACLTTGTSFCQVPIIISQSSNVNACEGDSVTLIVITDKAYNFQWYTALKNYEKGFYNFTELVGENSYTLTLNPVLTSHYYLLRIINHTDTLWSAEIRLEVELLRKPIDDTIFTRELPALINIFPKIGYSPQPVEFIWSTGDTTHDPPLGYYTEFWHLGKSWVTTKMFGCSRTDTFQVVQCPSILHINEDNDTLQCWCADTIYIEKDIHREDGITIIAGTTVKFTGNYSLRSSYINAYGFKKDSIYILGYTEPLTQLKQGNLSTSTNGYGVPRNSFNNLVIRNMHSVDLAMADHTNFSENESLSLKEVNDCIIRHNKRVELKYSVQNSTMYENDSIFGIPETSARGSLAYFSCNNNIFKSNKTGLVIKGMNRQYCNSFLQNNIFENNISTAVTVNTPINYIYIDQNIFQTNTSLTGPSVCKVNFKEVLHELDGLTNISFYFRNNTLYNNKGQNCIGICINDTLIFSGNILNNVFWNNPMEAPFEFKILKSGYEEFDITNNSFRGDETSLALPEDNTFRIAGNLFETYPDFSDTLNSLLTLKESSPLIDAGTDTVFTNLYPSIRGLTTTDFTGFPRKIGNAVDIGAYEYHRIAPLAFSYVTPDTIVCLGDSVALKALPIEEYREDLYKYNWYKDGAPILNFGFQNILRLNAFGREIRGSYYAALSNSVDTLWSIPIFVDYEKKPVTGDQPILQEACMGMGVEFQIKTRSIRPPVCEWYSNKNGQLPSTSDSYYLKSAVESDTLYVTATNLCGSASYGPIKLFVFPLPEPNLGNDTCIYPADSILLDAGPDYICYSWSTGEQGRQINAHASDTVWVMVTNWHSCLGSDTIVINSLVLLDPSINKTLTFHLYPNPANRKLFVKIPDNTDLPCIIGIVSQDGKLISEKEIKNTEEQVIDVSTYRKGIYFIRINSASATGSGKFVVL